MSKDKIDLRKKGWREAITDIADAVEKSPLTERAIALLVADICGVNMGQVRKVLAAIPQLKKRYLKNG